MLRVAEMATQIAAAEAHENSGRTAMEAFALEGIEYFVNLEHYVWIASSFLLAMTRIGNAKLSSVVVRHLLWEDNGKLNESPYNLLGIVFVPRCLVDEFTLAFL